MLRKAILLFLLFASVSVSATELRDIVGVAHVGGVYTFNPNWNYTTNAAKLPTDPTWDPAWGSPNYLVEGASEIKNLGSRVIKLWFHPNAKAFYWFCDPCYNPLPDYNDLEHRLVTLAQAPGYFKAIFDDPAFTTIVLVIMNNAPNDAEQFHDGMSSEEIAVEKNAMYNLTKYLLQTYKNSGKTFVLQNWEGDNLLTDNYGGPNNVPQVAINGFIDWTNARQDGVTQAREEVGSVGVQVAYALEVNLLSAAANGTNTNCVTTWVVPSTHCDLYSYSSWDSRTPDITNDDPQFGEKAAAQLAKNLHHLAFVAPNSALYGDKNIYIGEFGANENDTNLGDGCLMKERLRRQIETAIAWGVRWVIYWEIYCNGPIVHYDPPGHHYLNNSELYGYWLIRLDGSLTELYHYLKDGATGCTDDPTPGPVIGKSVFHAGLRSTNNYYVSADQGGGNATVTVDRTWLQEWENFAILSRTNSTPSSGDSVNLLTYNGHYLSANNAGGGTVSADRTWDRWWEQFTINKISGSGPITHDDQVSFATSVSPPYYLTATNGGGTNSLLAATSTTVSSNETFRLTSLEPVTGVCSYTLSVPSLAFGSQGGSVSASVTANNQGCDWVTASSDSFVILTPVHDTGNGSVEITVAPNTGSERTATITIAGQSFPLTQGGYDQPYGLIATPQSAFQVHLTWSDTAPATSYEIARKSGSAFSVIGTSTLHSYDDYSASSNHAYIYKVRAVRSGGSFSGYSNTALGTTMAFTDPTLVAGITVVKAVHLTELRTAVNLVRTAAGLGNATFTDAAPSGVLIKVVHVQELRTALEAALTAAALNNLPYARPTLTPGTSAIAAVDFQELRNGVRPIP